MRGHSSLVVFCGTEFRSASRNVTRLIDASSASSTKKIACVTVDQSLVTRTVLESTADSVVLVPLMHKLDCAKLFSSSSSSRVKLVHQWGVGLEGVDIPLATKHGVLVANTPSTPVTARATAELAVKLLLDCARPSYYGSSITRGDGQDAMENQRWGEPRGRLLGSLQIGVVGGVRGALGMQICRILENGFLSSSSSSGYDGGGRLVRRIGREHDLVQASRGLDVLILAAPLDKHTRGFVNAQVLAALNPGAIVINVGRGPLVDRDAMLAALARDADMRFGTDVWFHEPPCEDDRAMLAASLQSKGQVTITPHIGGVAHEAASLNDERCSRGILDFIQTGKLPQYCVNPPVPSAAAVGSTTTTTMSQVRPISALSPQHHHQAQHVHHHHKTKVASVYKELAEAFTPARVITSPVELLRRGTDESWHEPIAPDLAFMPHTTQEVQRCVEICQRHFLPIIPFGAGTCLEGGVAAPLGGLSIDTSHMNQILEINKEDFDCLVQPGVTRMQLAEALKPTGLFFPVDPGANASLGGMTATRASGTTAVRHGTMRDRVMGVQAVLPDGSVIDTTRVRAIKSSAGLDLTSLFVGSEGTLGVITQIRLKLVPVAECIRSAVVRFTNAESAINAVIQLKQLGVPLARAEFLDACTMRAVSAAGFGTTNSSSSNSGGVPTLFLEFHGTELSVLEQCTTAQQVCGELAGFIEFAHSSEERERALLWKSRHNAYYSVMKLRGENLAGTKGWPTDVCVPISKLYQCMHDTWLDIEKHGIIAPIFGHVGDGNFHCILLYNKQVDGEAGLAKLQAFNDRLVARALALEGTCTGEHGLGYGKKSWLDIEHGKTAADLMRLLKRSIDPQNLMNPGKVY